MPISLMLPVAALACAAPASDVAVGNPLRPALLDALRPAIARDLGQPVKFRVDRLRACGDWAFALVEPQTPAGQPIDMAKTRYREQIESGAFDGASVYALLRREGRRWKVETFTIGPTDVVWLYWVERYGLPETLFQPPE